MYYVEVRLDLTSLLYPWSGLGGTEHPSGCGCSVLRTPSKWFFHLRP